MTKRKKSVNIVNDNIIYRPRIDDETNDLINELNSEIKNLECKLLESYKELDDNKEIIKELEKQCSTKKQNSNSPLYPLYYMYIPIYPIYHSYISYLHPTIFYPLCR